MAHFGEILADLRRDKGLQQKELGKELILQEVQSQATNVGSTYRMRIESFRLLTILM